MGVVGGGEAHRCASRPSTYPTNNAVQNTMAVVAPEFVPTVVGLVRFNKGCTIRLRNDP